MLLNLSKKAWSAGLSLGDYAAAAADNAKTAGEMRALAARYGEAVAEEADLPPEKRAVAGAGKMDARKHLAAAVTHMMSGNIDRALGTMLDTIVF